MPLNAEFFDKITAKIVQDGETDDLAKFMLAGKESLLAVQNYFHNLDADEKRRLTLQDDTWSLECNNAHSGLSLFKIIAPSIIPFIGELYLINSRSEDYSFLKDVKYLCKLYLQFADEEHLKALSALSSLRYVYILHLNISGFNLQMLSSFSFSFEHLRTQKFKFDADPKCDKVFQAQTVELFGDKELKNDFVFTRQNFQTYATFFPKATKLSFIFYVKIVDNVSDLLKIADYSYDQETNIGNCHIELAYQFFDYSGFPESKVLKTLQNNGNWDYQGYPFSNVHRVLYSPTEMLVSCSFPLAIADGASKLAEKPLHRIPEDSNDNSEDYYRVTIVNELEYIAEFEILKTLSCEELLKGYGEITGMGHDHLYFEVNDRWISHDGTVADTFKDGDVIVIFHTDN